MKPALTTSALLDVWERGLTDPPQQRALGLLASAYPEMTLEQIKTQPIGQRDTRLMEIHEALFGAQLICLTACPKCGERLEIALDLTQLRTNPESELANDLQGADTHALIKDGFEVHFRLPNSADLLLLASLSDANAGRIILFERCVQQASRAGIPVLASQLPAEMVDIIATRMAQIDPQADIQIALSCPACAEQWSTAFEILSYLWSEINTWAIRLLREVHQLARAYGWREADILALSPLRRQFYLELIG